MTKAIRIENADTSDHKVLVQVWEKSENGDPDKLIEDNFLNYPTSMVEKTIWKQRYLVIKEI